MEQNGAGAGEATVPWEELLGSKDWSGLVSPLVPDLRDHLLRCGSFCQIAGDSFISDSQSKYIGKCRYSPASILRHVFFKETADTDYVVDVPNTNIDGYLYTSIRLPNLLFLADTNWMGYVAVSSDALHEKTGRRDIYVALRGTVRALEWLADIDIELVPFPADDVDGDVKIMKGWRDIYTTRNVIQNIPSAQEHLRAVIKQYLDKYQDENPSIICVGHSLGGSLAILSAFDIASSGLSKINGEDIQVCAVAFDAPKVGNQAFNDALEILPKTKVLRINNTMVDHNNNTKAQLPDIVPYWPFGGDYVDTGKILQINSEKSNFLKSYEGDQLLGKIPQRHSLQVILHTVTGWRSTDFDNDSELVKARLPLVNRGTGHLKAGNNKVIENWWVEKNKGMMYDEKKDIWYESPVPWN